MLRRNDAEAMNVYLGVFDLIEVERSQSMFM